MNAYHRYAETHITAATPLELVVSLYERAFDWVIGARDLNRQGDRIGRGRAISKATEILAELTISLQGASSIANQLRRLYDYMMETLRQAHVEESEDKLTEVAGLLQTLLESWRKLAQSSVAPAQSIDSPVFSEAALEPAATSTVGSAYARW